MDMHACSFVLQARRRAYFIWQERVAVAAANNANPDRTHFVSPLCIEQLPKVVAVCQRYVQAHAFCPA